MSGEKKSADDHKELGNTAFAKQDYQTAIEHYSKAIQSNPPGSNRHIFFSNRSASYAGLRQWSKAIEDAKECIRLNPQFIKGYYRLATAQLETKDFHAAEASVKQGLSLEANNAQLLKVLRSIKLHKKAAEEAKKTGSTQKQQSAATAGGGGGGTGYPSSSSMMLDAATSQELQDLRRQHAVTVREYNLVNADLLKAVREDKMYNLTLKELQEHPATGGGGDGGDSSTSVSNGDTAAAATGSGINTGGGMYYRSVGKIFMKSSQQDVMGHLHKTIEVQQKKQKDHKGKLEYLEKKLKSQQLNMNELTSNASNSMAVMANGATASE